MVLRLATLTYGMDYFSVSMKQQLQNLFRVNPEEIRSYVLATIQRTYTFVHKDAIQNTYGELVEIHKATYTKLVSTEHQKQHMIWAERILALLIIGLVIYYTIIHGGLRLGVIVGILLVGRYLVMGYFWKHIPHIPLAKEIVDISMWIISHRKNILDASYHFIRSKK